MDLFWTVGVSFVSFVVSYTVLMLISDCDVRLLLASIIGRKNLRKLKNKVVWVTGASSGIGEYIARALASHGAKLVLTARNGTELERVKGKCLEFGKLSPDDVLVLPMDVTDIDGHRLAFDRVLKHFNRLDILINNAGRGQRAIWEEIELQVDRDIFELNVFSNINLTRIVTKYFLERNEGHIVVTSSIVGLLPLPYTSSYSATKFALQGYYGSLLLEKCNNLNVTILNPGPVVSNLIPASFTEKSAQRFGQSRSPSYPRMTAERCAFLSVIAIANNLHEAWMAKSPILWIVHMKIYWPGVTSRAFKKFGTNVVKRLKNE